MSTKNVTRKQTSKPVTAGADPSAAAAELANRRARTRLLIGPTLNLLRSYLRDVTAHLEETIEQLEGVEAWTDGAELSPELQLLGKLAERVYTRPDDTLEENRQLHALIEGPVLLAEVALTELCRQASSDKPHLLGESATTIASALRHSDPNHEAETDDMAMWFDNFACESRTNGFEVNLENIGDVIDTARSEQNEQVGHG